MNSFPFSRTALAAALAGCVIPALSQTVDQLLPEVMVEGYRSPADKVQSPATTERVTADSMADTTNAVNIEDALKYLPDVLVRKRFIGDTQAPMSSRTTGINASARTLIYADGVLLSALVANNNGNGSPRWFMVTPEEIERIDVMYGPFSAAYPGNSYGAVTEIVTRMPKAFESSAKVTLASQNFNLYGSHDSTPSRQFSALVGNRNGALSWRLSANHLDSYSQPITFLSLAQSNTAAGAGTAVLTGAYADTNRSGSPIMVVGAGGLTHTRQDSAKLKFALDFTPTAKATYTLGYWQNKSDAHTQSYLTAADGTSYYGVAKSNASIDINGSAYSANSIANLFSDNTTDQQHWMQSLVAETKTEGSWDWQAVISDYRYVKDISRNSNPARITDANGTGWSTVDLKAIWRPQGIAGTHIVSFGAHQDQYRLQSPIYNTTDWRNGSDDSVFSDSRGKTSTRAVWAQDVWRLAPTLAVNLGARYEAWRAYDGFNLSTISNGTAFPISQPAVEKSGWSPKASLTWQIEDEWSLKASLAKALRFPTVGELYQTVQTGSTFTQADPFLKPEKVKSGELALERNTENGNLRLSLFEERVSDALIAQTSLITGYANPVQFVQNIDTLRQRGIELSGQQKNVGLNGLELNGSVTYVDARILANSSYVAPANLPDASSVGKRTPYVPAWRATLVATYRPDAQWAYTLAARYSSRLFSTIDNTDINPTTYQGFEGFFVADARVRYQIDSRWSAAFGIDNLNNRKYFLYHPFPQRTIFGELKFTY